MPTGLSAWDPIAFGAAPELWEYFHEVPMKAKLQKTWTPTPDDIDRTWYVADAEGMPLGRLASEVAQLLRGKHKPTFAPHFDMGDYVIVINAEKVFVTGTKETS